MPLNQDLKYYFSCPARDFCTSVLLGWLSELKSHVTLSHIVRRWQSWGFCVVLVQSIKRPSLWEVSLSQCCLWCCNMFGGAWGYQVIGWKMTDTSFSLLPFCRSEVVQCRVPLEHSESTEDSACVSLILAHLSCVFFCKNFGRTGKNFLLVEAYSVWEYDCRFLLKEFYPFSLPFLEAGQESIQTGISPLGTCCASLWVLSQIQLHFTGNILVMND